MSNRHNIGDGCADLEEPPNVAYQNDEADEFQNEQFEQETQDKGMEYLQSFEKF